MQLKQLFEEDDAVSPVIGVILMVAITVILAAVIATFVLGLGEQVSDTAPQSSFSFDYDNGVEDGQSDSWNNNVTTLDITDTNIDPGHTNISADDVDGALTIQHTGGPTVKAELLGASGSNAAAFDEDAEEVPTGYDDFSEATEESWVRNDARMSAGESVTIFIADDDSISIIWTSDDGGSSATLQTFDGPES